MAKKPEKLAKSKVEWEKVGPSELKSRQAAAQAWFQEKIRGSYVRSKPMTAAEILQRGRDVKKPLAGQMIFFQYDAKWKDVLPFWDAFPLSIVLEPNHKGDSFLSLNVHYLPYSVRELLIRRLLETVTDDRLDHRTKARISYGLVKATSNFGFAKFALKRHLYSHVKSKVVRVPALEWPEAIYLNTARWAKKSQSKVFTEYWKSVGDEEL